MGEKELGLWIEIISVIVVRDDRLAQFILWRPPLSFAFIILIDIMARLVNKYKRKNVCNRFLLFSS